MSSATRRLLILLASALLLVIAVGSIVATALLFRAFVFEQYSAQFLVQIVTVVFLPLMTFCMAVLAVVMLDRYSVTKAKNKSKR